MQSQPKGFWTNGGKPLVAGIVLALVSFVVSVVPIVTGADPFAMFLGENATAHLLVPGSVFGMAYFVVVVALIADGVVRLMEAGNPKDDQPADPFDANKMHPVT